MNERRFSRQREEIYQAVYASRQHPTAEMVYQQLKPDMPKLSLGTVYRNLRQMAEEGRLLQLDGPVIRFDGNTVSHTHFRCTECGCVLDLDVPYDCALDRAADQSGCKISKHDLMFSGICPNCLQKN